MSITRRAMAVVSALVLASGLVAVTGTSASAAPAAKKPVLTVRDLPAQVRLVPGESVRLVLQTNLTTGYTWKAEGGCCTKDDKPIARVSRGVYKAPADTGGMVGVPGTTTWIITAVRPGTTQVEIVTSPPGAQNTMNDETVGTMTVIVMKP
jgi:predicted secreted protein